MPRIRSLALAASLFTLGLAMAGCGGSNAPSGQAMPQTTSKTGASGPAASSTSPSSSSSSSAKPSPAPSSSSSAKPSTTAPASAFQKKYLTVDSASKTVVWQLDGGVQGAGSPYNYNGDSAGKMILTVPKGWKVTVHFKNVGKLSHSAVITKTKSATAPAFPGATTPNPKTGIPPGGKYTFGFTPTSTGTFYVVCLVPGHVQSGMWDVVKVVSTGQPSLKG